MKNITKMGKTFIFSYTLLTILQIAVLLISVLGVYGCVYAYSYLNISFAFSVVSFFIDFFIALFLSRFIEKHKNISLKESIKFKNFKNF